MKSNKSFNSRIKKTKTGKLLMRKQGHGHFNTKNTGTERINKRKIRHAWVPKKIKQRFVGTM